MLACPATDDFFRLRIDHMIDLRHPLAVMASRTPWQEIEAQVSQVFSRKGRAGAAMPDLDLFGEHVQRVSVLTNAGRPRVPLHIMITLLYLKHAFNESDEGVVARWADTPRWQFFSGCVYYEDRRPCDATTLVKFRQLLGEEGVEELLAQTINVAVELKLIKPQELTRVIVDSTVQHKAIAHPTDSRLLETARAKLVEAAKDAGINLKQTFAKEGKEQARKAGRYAHARQLKRKRQAIKRQRTVVGRLRGEIDRQASVIGQAVRQALNETLNKAGHIVAQSGQRKAADGQPKLCTRHAHEVDCISKGKTKQPYKLGVKVGIASTIKGNLIVRARGFHGNPYDGHTLREQLEQATILMQDSQAKAATAFVDLSYRGVHNDNPHVRIVYRGKAKRITEQERKLLKRRQFIEPIIAHLKTDHSMDGCHLKGEIGDRLHAVRCAAGYNIRWLLCIIVTRGITFLQAVFLCLKQASALGRSWLDSVMDRFFWTADVRSTLSTALDKRLTLAASKLSQA